MNATQIHAETGVFVWTVSIALHAPARLDGPGRYVRQVR